MPTCRCPLAQIRPRALQGVTLPPESVSGVSGSRLGSAVTRSRCALSCMSSDGIWVRPLNQGNIAPPGDIWQSLETLLIVTTGRVMLAAHLVGRGQGCC